MAITTPSSPVYTVKQISYEVPSHSAPGTKHTVQVNPITRRPTSCSCPARGECWHMKMIASGKHSLKPRMRVGVVEELVPSFYDPKAVLAAESRARAHHAATGARAIAPVSDLYA